MVIDTHSNRDTSHGIKNSVIELVATLVGIGHPTRDRQSAIDLIRRLGTGPALLGACLADPLGTRGASVGEGQRLEAAFQLVATVNDPPHLVELPSEYSAQTAPIGDRIPVMRALNPMDPHMCITFSMGAPLNALSPVGGYVAHMLREHVHMWWVVYARPCGPPSRSELMGAVRFLRAAHWTGLHIQRFLIRSNRLAWEIAHDSKTP